MQGNLRTEREAYLALAVAEEGDERHPQEAAGGGGERAVEDPRHGGAAAVRVLEQVGDADQVLREARERLGETREPVIIRTTRIVGAWARESR